jgi:hypothetical protein
MKLNSIWLIIITGSLLRLIFAATSLTIVYPDEHFQILEPANWVVNGFGWKSWEWYHGVRSWFVPSLYMPLLLALKSWGIAGGPNPIYACRIFTAVFSCIALWRFSVLLRDRGLGKMSQLVATALFAFSGTMIVWSATTFTETWVACALMIVMPSVLKNLNSYESKKWIIAGALIGLTFPMRIQILPWAAALGLIFLLGSKERRMLLFFVLGYFVPVALQGILDWATWGYPFYSAYKYVKVAVLGGVVDSNGTSPWYSYFLMMPKNLGWLFVSVFCVCAILAIVSRKMRWQRQDLWLIAPAAALIGAHMLIGHKQSRFVMPTYFVFFYLIGLFVQAILGRWPLLVKKIESWTRFSAVAVMCLVFSFFTWRWLYSPSHVPTNEMGELGAIVFADGGFKSSPQSCLLIVDHYWIWTRGEMILGQKVEFRDRRSIDVKVADLQECLYAFTQGSWSAQLFREWKLIGRDRWGNSVYRHGV